MPLRTIRIAMITSNCTRLYGNRRASVNSAGSPRPDYNSTLTFDFRFIPIYLPICASRVNIQSGRLQRAIHSCLLLLFPGIASAPDFSFL
jgi:hypothetical protein